MKLKRQMKRPRVLMSLLSTNELLKAGYLRGKEKYLVATQDQKTEVCNKWLQKK